MVFRCRAQHRRAANVDIFDQRGKIVGLCALRLERVEIDRQQIDPADLLGIHRGKMLFIVTSRQ